MMSPHLLLTDMGSRSSAVDGYLEEKNPKGKTGLHMRLNVLSHNSTK
jgi:hypothetical protein